jgi:hypothetical protein
MTTAATHNQQRGILGYHESLEEQIFQFQREAYPARREDWIAPRWRWMFLDSARRLGVEPMVWLYRNTSGIVAHQGAIAVKLKVGPREVVTGWFVETMALEAVRGKSIGPMLILKAKEDLPFNLSLGQTENMRALQFKMGWKQVAPLETVAFVLNSNRVLQGKFQNSLVRGIVAAGLRTRQFVNFLAGRRRLHWKPAVSEISRFGDAHDRLWDEVKHDYPCAVVRDASFLNWKYVDQPGQDFICLEVRKEQQIVAVAIVLVREPEQGYHYRRGFIVDLVVKTSDPEIVWATFDEVRKVCKRRHADMLIFSVINKTLGKLALHYGFLPREPKRFFLVSAGSLSSEDAQMVSAANNWFVTMGDSDIDRPW